MISGRQVREARQRLGWDVADVARRAKVPAEVVTRAESTDATPSVTLSQAAKIKAIFEAVGVHFGRSGAVMIAADRLRDTPKELG